METKYLETQSKKQLECFTQETANNYTRLDFIECKNAIDQTKAYIKSAEQLLQNTYIDTMIETIYPLRDLSCTNYKHKFKERNIFRNGYNIATTLNKNKMYTHIEMQKLLEICMKSATIGTSVYIEQQANNYINSLNKNTEMANVSESIFEVEAYKTLLNDIIELLQNSDNSVAIWIQEQMLEITEIVEQLEEQCKFNDE